MVMELSTIWITGSRGFLWSQLQKKLDSLWIPFVCFSGDLLDREDVHSFFEKNTITTLIHLAGISQWSFEDLMQVNVQGTKNLLEIWSTFGVKKIIYSSSGAVYGSMSGSKNTESSSKLPSSYYGLSKLHGEQLIQYFEKNFSLTFCILRFSSIYGESSQNGVASIFQESIEKHQKITITWTGNEERDFLYIDDAIDSIVLALSSQKNIICNISSDCHLSLNGLAQEFQKKYDFSIEYSPSNNTLKNVSLDYSLATKELWYAPKYNSLIIK
jgi:UDP-glucose 4-epimerase